MNPLVRLGKALMAISVLLIMFMVGSSLLVYKPTFEAKKKERITKLARKLEDYLIEDKDRAEGMKEHKFTLFSNNDENLKKVIAKTNKKDLQSRALVKAVVKKKKAKKVIAKTPLKRMDVKNVVPDYRKRDLDLTLVEVFNLKKYKKVLKGEEVEGSAFLRGSEITNIEVSLDNGDNMYISEAKIVGNTIKYKVEDQTYSGLFISSGPNKHTINFVNGPFQGTRLMFMTQQGLAEMEEKEATRNVASEIPENKNQVPLNAPENQYIGPEQTEEGDLDYEQTNINGFNFANNLPQE